ncbi:hypothetical protein J6B78_08980, partial [Methanocorpusculum sp.]|nr:hypothetical protein [Methanocorpusculum sp.]
NQQYVNGPNTLQPYSTEFFSFTPPHHINYLHGYRSLKRFWKGFGGTFSSKRFPQEKQKEKTKGNQKRFPLEEGVQEISPQ